MLAFPQVSSSQNQNISPEISTFCNRVFSRAARFPDSKKNIYVNGCNAFLYPDRYTPEGPIVVKPPPVKVEPDKGNTCAAFGDGNVICSLAPSHPLRPKQGFSQVRGDKNQLLLNMYAKSHAARIVPSYLHKGEIERMQIAAQLQELRQSKEPWYGPSGASKCFVIQGTHFRGIGTVDTQRGADACSQKGGVVDGIWD